MGKKGAGDGERGVDKGICRGLRWVRGGLDWLDVGLFGGYCYVR